MVSTDCAEWRSFPPCGYCSTSRQNHFKGSVAPLIARCEISEILSFGLLEGDSVQKRTSHPRSLERQHLMDQHWAWCSAANGKWCASCSNMSTGWWPFSTLRVQTSSSAWMAQMLYMNHPLFSGNGGKVLCTIITATRWRLVISFVLRLSYNFFNQFHVLFKCKITTSTGVTTQLQ